MLSAVYVRQTRAIPYADTIVQGYKTIETRTRNTLGRFVGQRVLIIRSVARRWPEVVGSVRITSGAHRSQEWLESKRNQTLIPPGSRFDSDEHGKWCYGLAEPVKYEEPIPLSCFNVTRRTRTFVEVE